MYVYANDITAFEGFHIVELNLRPAWAIKKNEIENTLVYLHLQNIIAVSSMR